MAGEDKPIDAETKLLASMAYGESSAQNVADEMSALASVLVRQRNARGYTSMADFTKGERTFSYVTSDKNPRYNKMIKATDAAIRKDAGMSMAIAAAESALKGGPDKSNGAYFWDGGDIKTHYDTHFKVGVGIKFTDPSHNIYGIAESTDLHVKTKVVKKRVNGKIETKTEEVGRYDHVYDSTTAIGGTIFWKNNDDYMKLTKCKPYK